MSGNKINFVNANCFICKIKLNKENIACYEDGSARLDAHRNLWCISCTEEFDNIEHGGDQT